MAQRAWGEKISFLFGCHRECPDEVLACMHFIQKESMARGLDHEVILVDDSGTGRFKDLQAPNTLVLVNEENRGKGFSLARATTFATGTIFVYSDCDLPVDLFAALDFLENAKLDLSKTLLAGNRRLTSTAVRDQQSRSTPRVLASWVFRMYVRMRLGCDLGDTQCPLKVMSRPIARGLFRSLTIHGYAFDVELLLNALASGIEIKSIPIIYRDGRAPMSWLQVTRHTFKMMRDVNAIANGVPASTLSALPSQERAL